MVIQVPVALGLMIQFAARHGAKKAITKFGQKNWDRVLKSKSKSKKDISIPEKIEKWLNKPSTKKGFAVGLPPVVVGTEWLSRKEKIEHKKLMKTRKERERKSGVKHLGSSLAPSQGKQYGGMIRKYVIGGSVNGKNGLVPKRTFIAIGCGKVMNNRRKKTKIY